MDAKALENAFSAANTDNLPGLRDLSSLLEKILWILLTAKENSIKEELTSEEISSILRKVYGYSVKPGSITQSIKRAGDKIHTEKTGGTVVYSIMTPGIDFLLSSKGLIEVFHFEPGRKYSTKLKVTQNIFKDLKGGLRIVDPHCDSGTLSVLYELANPYIRVLTSLDNISNPNKKKKFLADIIDLQSERRSIEFRNRTTPDIHDRYILASDSLVILGYSIKDLGNKESFAITLKKDLCGDLFSSLSSSFDGRWKASVKI